MRTIDFEKLEPYRSEIVGFKISLFNSVISYYKNNYLPEMAECHGYSQADALTRVMQEKENFVYNEKTKTPLEFLGLEETEILNFLRMTAIEYRERAADFQQNPFIKIGSLRKAVTLTNLLIEFEPQLKIYTLHFLCSRNKISLT